MIIIKVDISDESSCKMTKLILGILAVPLAVVVI